MSGSKWANMVDKKSPKSRDPIDEELKREDEEIAREAKHLRLTELIEKRKKRIAQIKGAPTGTGAGATTPGLSVADAAQISKLPPEEQQSTMETYAKWKSVEKASGAGGMSMLPFLLMYRQSNPSASQSQMMDFMSRMVVALKPQQQNIGEIAKVFEAGVAAAKAGQGVRNESSIMKDIFAVLKPIYEQASEKDRQLLLSQIANPLDTLKELKAFNESMGFTGQGQNQQLAVQLEQIRGDRELKIEELRQSRIQQERQFQMERENRLWDREDNQNRWNQVTNILEGPLGKTIQKLGDGATSKLTGQPTQAPQQINPQQPLMIQCRCGGTFAATPGQKEYLCPHCNTKIPAEHLQPSSQNPPGNTQPPPPKSSEP